MNVKEMKILQTFQTVLNMNNKHLNQSKKNIQMKFLKVVLVEIQKQFKKRIQKKFSEF